MWKDRDEILVGIEGYGPKYSKKYVIRVASDGNPIVLLSDDGPVYWQSTQAKKVRAWYPVDSKVHLDNQTTSNGLAYALYAETADAVDYSTKNIILPFTHKLSKVRVVLEGDRKNDVTDVKIKTYTSCTLNADGTLTAGDTEDFIPMAASIYNVVKCWEANVVPRHEITKIMVNGIENTLTKPLTPQAAKVNTITLTVRKEEITEVNVSEISGKEYTVSGNVYLKGNGQSKDLKLTMEAGAKLTIEDIVLAPATDGNVITCQGDATIKLKGSNTLTARHDGRGGSSGICVESGTLTINGDDNAELVVTGAGLDNSGIGAKNGANITINGGQITADARISNVAGIVGESAGIGSSGYNERCGTITINGGIIETWGGKYAAGIGCSNSSDCGDIIITGGNIKAYGGREQPGIGNGNAANCGNITISGANTVVYAKKGPGGNPSSIGRNNYSGKCGTVTIGSECTVTQE